MLIFDSNYVCKNLGELDSDLLYVFTDNLIVNKPIKNLSFIKINFETFTHLYQSINDITLIQENYV